MRSASWLGLVVMAAACHRQPAPMLEYGETVTYTSTASDPAPPSSPAAHATAGVPASAPAAPAPRTAEPQPEAATGSDGEWTTTVHTGDVRNVSSPAEPAEPAPAGAEDAPPPAGERPPPRQWYKAKPW